MNKENNINKLNSKRNNRSTTIVLLHQTIQSIANVETPTTSHSFYLLETVVLTENSLMSPEKNRGVILLNSK